MKKETAISWEQTKRSSVKSLSVPFVFDRIMHQKGATASGKWQAHIA